MNTQTGASTRQTVWSEGYRPTKEDLKSLYHYTFETASGLVIECHLEYEKEEKQTWDEPGCDASCELIWALVGGIDIAEVISDEWKKTIEEEALQQMVEDANDAKADAAEAAYEARRDDEIWGPL